MKKTAIHFLLTNPLVYVIVLLFVLYLFCRPYFQIVEPLKNNKKAADKKKKAAEEKRKAAEEKKKAAEKKKKAAEKKMENTLLLSFLIPIGIIGVGWLVSLAKAAIVSKRIQPVMMQ